MQLILKDSYPTLPPPLELEMSDQSSIKNYLECLKNNIFSNEGPSTVFRIDISIEEKKFNGLAISIFHVRRFKFLYRNKNSDSIDKVILKY